jgi:hypothetical protein
MCELINRHRFVKKSYDVDGNGLAPEPKAESKVISLFGRIQAGWLKSAGRGQLTSEVL